MMRAMMVVALFAVAPVAGAQTSAAPTRDKYADVYWEFQVQEPATQARGTMPPVYPPELKAAGVAGRVLAQFVVDADGTPDMRTFKVLTSSHDQFTRSVYEAVKRMRFVPARIDDKPVRQVVQQPFVFSPGK